ncbi:MAG: hypothetical protein WBA67_06265 [Jannaschia sp.]
MMVRFLCLAPFVLGAAANSQQLRFTDSSARHDAVQSLDIDCGSGFPVAVAGSDTDMEVSVWAASTDLARMDSAMMSATGPVAVTTGQGVAGTAFFKTVTASVLEDGTPLLTVWGVGNGALSRMTSLPLQSLPKNPVKLEIVWTSTGLVLASLTGPPVARRLDLVALNVNYATGAAGIASRTTLDGASDFSLGGDPAFPEAAVAIRTASGIFVRDYDPAEGDLSDTLFRTAEGFALAPVDPDNLTSFDVGVADLDEGGERIVRLAVLRDDGHAFLVSETGTSAFRDVPLQSVSLALGPADHQNFQALGQRVSDGRFAALNGSSSCDDTRGQVAAIPRGCFINPASPMIRPFDHEAYTVKIAGNGRMRLSSWMQRECRVGGGRVTPPPSEVRGAVNFGVVPAPVDPVAGLACAGLPAPEPVVTFRWAPVTTPPTLAGQSVAVDGQLVITTVAGGAACAAPGDPRTGDTTREPPATNGMPRDCIVRHANTNEDSVSLSPNTDYTWSVRLFDAQTGAITGFTAPVAFTVGGPPASARFIAPSPAPANDFPTPGKTLQLGPRNVVGKTVTVRWDPPACQPSSYAATLVERTETLIPCTPEEIRATPPGEECIPRRVIGVTPETISGACPAGSAVCQASGFYVERAAEYLLDLRQFNAFGSAESRLLFSVAE